MSCLSIRAKALILAVLTAAIFVVVMATRGPWTADPGTFLTLLGLCVASSMFKVVLPGVQGNLSMSFVLGLWGIVHMSLGETVLLGWLSSLIQCYWRSAKRPAAIQLAFNLAVVTVAIGAGWMVFRSAFLAELLADHLARMILAAGTYFLVNTLTVAAVIALTEDLAPMRVWRESYLWSFPHYLLGASVVGAIEYFRSVSGLGLILLVLPVAYVVHRTWVMHIRGLKDAIERAEERRRHAEETADLHLRTIRVLALAIEAKDQTTGEHLHRVQTYAVELGKDFGLSPDQLEALRTAAILHDVGKLAVPEHIISKPGKLTPEEFAKMKTHTVVGAEIIESIHFPFDVAPLVRSHHEKWDGSGYPDGLEGEAIPLGARILTAVDCLDALASDRQYRKAMPIEKAMSIIVAESGKSFDPLVVDALGKRCLELERLAKSTLSRQDLVRLSVDKKVERGIAPDAGYAVGSDTRNRYGFLSREQAFREFAVLEGISSQIGQSESIEADLCAIEDRLRQLVPFDCFALFRLRGERLNCVLARGEAAPLLLGLSIASGVGVSGWVAANRTPMMNGNAATEFGVFGEPKVGFTLSSGLAVPLESETGTDGVLTLYSRERDAFSLPHLRALLAISSKLAHRMRLDILSHDHSHGSPRPDPGVPLQLELLSQAIHGASATSSSSRGLSCNGSR